MLVSLIYNFNSTAKHIQGIQICIQYNSVLSEFVVQPNTKLIAVVQQGVLLHCNERLWKETSLCS